MAVTVGLLHTVPALAGQFEDLTAAALPGCRQLHLADPRLLAAALRDGVTAWVDDTAAAHAAYLAQAGAQAVLITCSSVGATADAARRRAGIPVCRVDAPMAQEAVTLAAAGPNRRVGVLATLASTLSPTADLLRQTAAAAGAEVELLAQVVDGAWAARAAGDAGRADQLTAAAIAALADQVDAVVLAQASMAAAAAIVHGGPPVLTSPASGVAAFAAAVRALGRPADAAAVREPGRPEDATVWAPGRSADAAAVWAPGRPADAAAADR
jgi:Asp/Glu/hydantoin racemase